jgi:hypothetical protein
LRYFEVLFGDFAESQSKDFKEAIDEEESGEDYGYRSDSDLEDGEDGRISPPKQTTRSKSRLFDLANDNRIVCEGHEEHVDKGKVVKISDMAFVTWVRARVPFPTF